MQPPNISATVATPLEVIATSCNLWDDKRNRVALVSNYDFLATDKIRQLKGCWIFLLYCFIFGVHFRFSALGFPVRKGPARCPDKSLPGAAADAPALSCSTAEIPG